MSESPTTTGAGPGPAVRRRPVRGFLWSLPLALGVVVLTLVLKIIELALLPMVLIAVLMIVLGTLWGTFGPAKPAAQE